MNNTAEKLPFSQRLGHVTGGVGHNLIYAMMAGYVSIFFTDVFGLNAGYVATLFLAARIWDAVNDPIMGLICDRTRSRFGHFRCWLLYASPVVGLALILCFRVPANAQTAGYAYAAIFYVLLGMSFTAVDIPYWGLPAAMTDDPAERTRVYTAAGMASTLASGAGAIAIPAMVTAFGADDQAGGYLATAAILAVVGVACYLTCFLLVRECRKPTGERLPFIVSVRAITKNRPLLILMAASLCGNIAFQLKIALNAYYATYSLGSFGYAMQLSAMLLPGMLAGAVLVPPLCRRMGAKKALFWVNAFGAVIAAAAYFAGYSSLYVVMGFLFLFAIVMGAFSVLINSMVADTIDYDEARSGRRSEGVITAARTFITKLATAIAGSAPLYIMQAAGFVPNRPNTAAVNGTIHLLISLVLGVLFALALLPAARYPLGREEMDELKEALRSRRSAD